MFVLVLSAGVRSMPVSGSSLHHPAQGRKADGHESRCSGLETLVCLKPNTPTPGHPVKHAGPAKYVNKQASARNFTGW
eukprot:2675779-Rhodomonas_salina.1